MVLDKWSLDNTLMLLYSTAHKKELKMCYGFNLQLQEDMRSGQIELDKYIITKSLTKQPEDYPDGKNQPHVQVHSFAPSSVWVQVNFLYC